MIEINIHFLVRATSLDPYVKFSIIQWISTSIAMEQQPRLTYVAAFLTSYSSDRPFLLPIHKYLFLAGQDSRSNCRRKIVLGLRRLPNLRIQSIIHILSFYKKPAVALIPSAG